MDGMYLESSKIYVVAKRSSRFLVNCSSHTREWRSSRFGSVNVEGSFQILDYWPSYHDEENHPGVSKVQGKAEAAIESSDEPIAGK